MKQNKRVGVIIEVDGNLSKVGMYNETNDSDYIWNGDILTGPKVGAYLTINQNDVKIIATVFSEKIIDLQNDVSNHEFDNTFSKNSIKRIISLKVKGVIENNNFHVTSKYVPMIGNVVTLTTKDELNLIYGIYKNELTINIGKSILEEYDINIPVNRFFASHIGIFGNTGSGKSNTLHKLYKELFQTKYAENMKIHSQFFVIDFNGEYTQENQFSLSDEFKKVFAINTGNKSGGQKLPILKDYILDADILSILFDAKPGTQVPFLRNAMRTYNEKIKNSATTFGQMEIGLLKRIIVSHKSVNDTSLNDWLEVTEKMGIAPSLLQELKSLKFDYNYGKLKVSNNGIIYVSCDTFTEQGIKNLKLNEIEKEIVSIFEESSEFKKLKYFLAFQRVYIYAWKSTNLEYINPLFKRIENSLNSLEKVIDLVDNIDDSYTFMNIISLVDSNQEITRLIPMLFSKMIYDEHKKYVTSCKKVTKTKHLIIDEAHNILNGQIRRNSDDWQDYRLGLFEEIIKEGRKFGFFMTIASQRPSDISPTIMSQIHNYIIHRLVNDNDLNMLINTMPTLDKFSFQMIPSLGQGEAVITGNAIKVPILVKVNKEKVIRPKSDDIELTNLWDDIDDCLSCL
ncbi:ATP-binding protein [Holdemanella biformis]|uniref:ATP-binding protein n=1 Tax=Holdemanella biformis TaxID=1735 RepID=UPI00319DC4DC